VSAHTCTRCGDPVENTDNRGWYRDHCWDCIEAIANEEPSHREQCDDPECLICQNDARVR